VTVSSRFFLLSLLALFAACDRLPSIPDVPARGHAPAVDVGPTKAGVLQRLHVGQALRVHLRASPASGDQWTFVDPLPPELLMESDPGLLPFDDVQQGAMQTWTFRAEHPGHARLSFVRRRPFAPPSEADMRHEFFVSIQ